MVADWLADRDVYAYLAGDGFLAYQWQHHDLFVACAEAVSGETVRAFWTQVGSHASIAEQGLRQDRPGQRVLVAHAPNATPTSRTGPGGCSAWSTPPRPSPPAVSPRRSRCSVVLRIDDRARPANSGLWDLAVAGGAGRPRRRPEA